jgi:excisionase family DNA binding protein
LSNYLTIDDAAAKTSLSHWTIRRALKNNELAFSRVGGRRVIRIADNDLEAWISRHRQAAQDGREFQ